MGSPLDNSALGARSVSSPAARGTRTPRLLCTTVGPLGSRRHTAARPTDRALHIPGTLAVSLAALIRLFHRLLDRTQPEPSRRCDLARLRNQSLRRVQHLPIPSRCNCTHRCLLTRLRSSTLKVCTPPTGLSKNSYSAAYPPSLHRRRCRLQTATISIFLQPARSQAHARCRLSIL